jgi:CRP-like cAMP-binding protein
MSGSTAQKLLEALAGEPLPEWSRAASAIALLEIKPGAHVFRTDEPARAVYFVRHGLLKLVYVTADGSEWIKNFSYENTFFASIAALQPAGRATFSAIAIERTKIECIDYDVLLELAERHMAWQRALRRGFELYGAKKEQRERDLLTLTAGERYAAFLRDAPSISQRVTQQDLALYLGVTPVALSRIRSRLAAS